MTDAGLIVIDAQRLRSLEQNRADALERLVEMIREALVEPKPRRPTRPTRASKERRLAGQGAVVEDQEAAQPTARRGLTRRRNQAEQQVLTQAPKVGLPRARPPEGGIPEGVARHGRRARAYMDVFTASPRHDPPAPGQIATDAQPSAMHDLQDRIAHLLVQHQLRVRDDRLEHRRLERELAVRFDASARCARSQQVDEVAEQRAVEELRRVELVEHATCAAP